MQQADKPLAPAAVKPHLKRVPAYLLPPTLRAAVEAAGAGPRGESARKQKRPRRAGGSGTDNSAGDTGGAAAAVATDAGGDRRRQSATEMVSRAASEVYRPRQNRVDPLRALARQAASSASALAAAGVGRLPVNNNSGKRRK